MRELFFFSGDPFVSVVFVTGEQVKKKICSHNLSHRFQDNYFLKCETKSAKKTKIEEKQIP